MERQYVSVCPVVLYIYFYSAERLFFCTTVAANRPIVHPHICEFVGHWWNDADR